MQYRRWLALLVMCIGLAAQVQPASADRAAGFATVLRVYSGTGLSFAPSPPGSVSITTTIACAHLTAGLDSAPPVGSGACTVNFSGQFSNGVTCVRGVGYGTGSITANGRSYPFWVSLEMTAATLTMTGAVAKDGETGTIAIDGALSSDPNSGTSCNHGTVREFIFTGTVGFFLR